MARFLGRMVFGEYVRRGWSSASIIRELAKTTGTYRRTTMLRDIREAQDIEAFGGLVQKLPVNVTPPRDIMVETTLRRRRKYRVFGRVKEINIETGRVSYDNISFYDGKLRTKEQWGNEYLRQKKESDSDPTVTIDEIDIWSIEHDDRFGY